MEGIWLAVGFIITSLLATTAVPSLPVPFAYLPLMLGGGILVMNRVNVVHGALWLVLSGVVLQAAGTAPGRLVGYAIAALVGYVLAERVFAKRSVYALIGLGLTTGAAFVIFESGHHIVAAWLNRASDVGMTLREAAWTLLLLVLALYVGFVLAVELRRWVEKTFIVR